MRKDWRQTVYLARSKIQGLGLYAKRDIHMGDMIIEYKGEVIRSEVGEMREKRYVAQNRGVYMFRIDEDLLVDATMAGGPARYINHSCDPNCSTRILAAGPSPEDKKIIITANRPIKALEEVFPILSVFLLNTSYFPIIVTLEFWGIKWKISIFIVLKEA
ncbi:unnamed protein product [Strongylus vulgaris]|uniref:SET domain-containing protein n=1 Tax=Strongylus vulgaris TaxID=40348 RepID=A0A3P7KYV4_STRVU|nr:unnamed protein product [Strongylus vulgaris]